MRICIVVIAAGLTLLPAAPASADARAELRSWHAAFSDACDRGDGAAVAALFTEDAVTIDPQQPPKRGRAEIAASFDYVFDHGMAALSTRADDVFGGDDTAVEVGTMTAQFRDGHHVKSRYMLLFKRVGGRWLAHRALGNAAP